MKADVKLCECGCGEPAPVASKTNRSKGHVKGEPMRFVNGHQMKGPLNGRWRGGSRSDGEYVQAWAPDHPHASQAGYVPEHRLVAERAVGNPLDPRHPVHHVNEDPSDNRPENLVICEDHAYHMLLHQRTRALEECGHAGWVKCRHCGEYDDPANDMYVPDLPGRRAHHRECDRVDARRRYHASREEDACAA